MKINGESWVVGRKCAVLFVGLLFAIRAPAQQAAAAALTAAAPPAFGGANGTGAVFKLTNVIPAASGR